MCLNGSHNAEAETLLILLSYLSLPQILEVARSRDHVPNSESSSDDDVSLYEAIAVGPLSPWSSLSLEDSVADFATPKSPVQRPWTYEAIETDDFLDEDEMSTGRLIAEAMNIVNNTTVSLFAQLLLFLRH